MKQRALVIRYGGYGDALQMSAVLPGLAAQGYEITVDVSEQGREVLANDPNVSGFLVTPAGSVPGDKVGEYWNARTNGFHKIVNLCESVEGAFLQLPGTLGFHRDDEARRRMYGSANYVEHMHRIAGTDSGVPWFHPTDEEDDKATAEIGHRPAVTIALSGSAPYKIWPHADELVKRLLDERPDVRIFLAGGDKDRELAAQCMKSDRVVDMIGWPLRLAYAVACRSTVVFGPETGLLNAVSHRPLAKVVLLSHSTPTNLVRDWPNATAIVPGVPCHPCHRLHASNKFCPVGPSRKFAACAESVPCDDVLSAVLGHLRSTETPAAQLAAD